MVDPGVHDGRHGAADPAGLIRAVTGLEPEDVDRLVREAAVVVRPTVVVRRSLMSELFGYRVGQIEDLAAQRERERRHGAAAGAGALISAQDGATELARWRVEAAKAIEAASARGIFDLQGMGPGVDVAEETGRRTEASRSMLDLALIACLAGPSLPLDAYKALAGPWWRAAAARADPAWVAPWSRLSLAGAWLTLASAAVIIAAGLVSGAQMTGTIANVELAALATGVGLLVAGLLVSSSVARARLFPMPVRDHDPNEVTHRIWRLPQVVVEALIRRR